MKPENLFLTTDGRVKILDFGLAKLAQPDTKRRAPADAPTLTAGTEPGILLGTVGYMSPEQLRGQPVDHRSDIFSFGAILYEMVSGRRAFHGASAADTTSAILKEDPPDLSLAGRDIPPGLERVVRHCLEKSPDDRFQSARDLAFDLEALSGHSVAARLAADQAPKRLALSPPALIAAVFVVSAIALAAGVLVGRSSARTEPASFDRVTFRRGAVLSARFGPDGRTILYSASRDGKPPVLYIKRPENPDAVPLELPAARLLAVSPTGEMAIQLDPRWAGWYVSRGTLARVALSGGAPREVAEDVIEVDWGPDGRLAAARDVAGKRRLESPLGKVLYETTGFVSSPRFSPRGDLIAFIDDPLPEDGTGAIAVIDLAGNKRLLSKEWVNVVGLAWATPDEIWFTAVGPRQGTALPDRSLYGVTVAGKLRLILQLGGGLILQDVAASGRVLLAQQKAGVRIKCLTQNEQRERDLSWLQAWLVRSLSGDGRTLAFYAEEPETAGSSFGVYMRKTDGSPPVRVGEGRGAKLSPDGKWVASVPRPGAPIVLLPTGPGEPKEVRAAGLSLGLSMAWLPDGKRLVFAGKDQGRALYRLYIQSVEGGEAHPISPEGVADELGGIVASPDGRLVAAVGPDRRIALYPVGGGAARSVAGAAEEEEPLQWSADGRSLYTGRPRELFSPAHVFLLDIQTGRRTPWKELMPEDSAGLVAITHICVTPDGKAYAYDYLSMLSDLYVAEGLK